MSDVSQEVDLSAWVDKAKANPVGHMQRQAIEITLTAISIVTELNQKLYLKGGILMGLAYDSPRQTTDIDLTTAFEVDEHIDQKIADLLGSALPRAAAALGYTSLNVGVHSYKRIPKGELANLSFPAVKIKIGFAKKDAKQVAALPKNKFTGTIEIDISFNETVHNTQTLILAHGRTLLAYNLIDLIAEKYRAMLQQAVRRRNRRQDAYDLQRLISTHQFSSQSSQDLMDAIVAKCASRNIVANQCSLDDPEIKQRSSAEWHTLKLEIGTLPDFEMCFKAVRNFYIALPWT